MTLKLTKAKNGNNYKIYHSTRDIIRNKRPDKTTKLKLIYEKTWPDIKHYVVIDIAFTTDYEPPSHHVSRIRCYFGAMLTYVIVMQL